MHLEMSVWLSSFVRATNGEIDAASLAPLVSSSCEVTSEFVMETRDSKCLIEARSKNVAKAVSRPVFREV
jgi:hypothetical protein